MSRWTQVAVYLALSLIWGSLWIANDWVREPPLRAGSIRFLLGALVLALPALMLRRRGAAHWKASLLLATTMIALPNVLVVWAAQHSSSALNVLLFAGLPLLTAFAMQRFQTVRIPRTVYEAGLIGAGGMALIVFDGLSFSAADVGAAAAILLAVVSHAASLVYAKRALRLTPVLQTTALQLAVASVLVFLNSAVMERGIPFTWRKESAVVLTVTALAGAIGLLLYYWLLRDLEPYQVATLQWAAPLVAIVEGVVAMRASPPWSVIGGTVVVLICTVVTIRIPNGDEEAVTLLVTSGPDDEVQQKLR